MAGPDYKGSYRLKNGLMAIGVLSNLLCCSGYPNDVTDKSYRLWRITWRFAARMIHNGIILCVMSSKEFALSPKPVAIGASCPTIRLRGPWFINRCGAG